MARLLSSPCTSLLLLIIASVSVIDVAGDEDCQNPPVDGFCEYVSHIYMRMELKDYPGCGIERDLDKYMVVMVDLDAPNPKNPTDRSWLHWVKKTTGADLVKGVTSDGKNDLVEFIPPYPYGPEPHRYQVYIIREPFDQNFQLIDKERPRWNVSKFGDDELMCAYLFAGYEFLTRNPNKDEVPTKKPDAPSTKQIETISEPPETQPHTKSKNKEPSDVATCSASLLIIFSSAFNMLMIFKIY
ncbi:hypothetical protein HELRODRAFT_173370 [Helobdella robusta]|uniref:Phosphatidylethanolamine-binding protein n=1 Tax=Helobdella robusta TaxID=6412 RepID=T1F6Q6_HELRO|nr:hypothetical protein HELRODRAFT_173370 [Helobdella robusta]ESO03672.1 hypothetical protein HELRODRAFT_173370 [Helobdella robusta]